MSLVTTARDIIYGWAKRQRGWGAGMNANLRQFDAVAFYQWGQRISTTSGLTYGYFGGMVKSGTGVSLISGGVVNLANNATNYIQRTQAGIVSTTTVGFDKTKIPMAIAVTSAGTITAVTDSRLAQVVPFIKQGGLIVDLESRGFALDGVADESTALQAVLDELHALGGGCIEFAGAINTGTTTINWRTNISLKGIGRVKSIINYSGSGANVLMIGCNFCTFEHVRFGISAAGATCIKIDATSAQSVYNHFFDIALYGTLPIAANTKGLELIGVGLNQVTFCTFNYFDIAAVDKPIIEDGSIEANAYDNMWIHDFGRDGVAGIGFVCGGSTTYFRGWFGRGASTATTLTAVAGVGESNQGHIFVDLGTGQALDISGNYSDYKVTALGVTTYGTVSGVISNDLGRSRLATLYDVTANTTPGADRNMFQAGVNGVTNGFSIQWVHATTEMVYTFLNGRVKLPAGTTAYPTLELPAGAAPTSPTDGMMWRIGADLFLRDGGATKKVTFT